MAPDIRIVPAIYEHIAPIAIHMRQADRDEVAAASGVSPFAALEFSFKKSTFVRTVLIDGVPSIMFGVGDINILAGVGAPWLLGTDAVERVPREFLRGSLEWRDQLLQRYSVLRNFVDVRNRISIRWLRWLGFTLSAPVEMRGHAFRLFELRSDDVLRVPPSDIDVDGGDRLPRNAISRRNRAMLFSQGKSAPDVCDVVL